MASTKEESPLLRLGLGEQYFKRNLSRQISPAFNPSVGHLKATRIDLISPLEILGITICSLQRIETAVTFPSEGEKCKAPSLEKGIASPRPHKKDGFCEADFGSGFFFQ